MEEGQRGLHRLKMRRRKDMGILVVIGIREERTGVENEGKGGSEMYEPEKTRKASRLKEEMEELRKLRKLE